MTLRAHIITRILRALRAADGIPMPADSLAGAVMPFVANSGHSDITAALSDMEGAGLVVGETDSITNTRSYILTTAGALRAKQIP